jgi:NAD(P)-dependent dehydrogenase (short-subunit alcohol dehydrogenase family)
MKDFSGKTVFITGGAGGIGRGMARAFASRGAKLALADIDVERLGETVASFAAEGTQAMAVPLDIVDQARWIAAADEVEAQLGPIAVLCNNAAIGGSSIGILPIHKVDPAQWRLLVEVNIFSAFHGIHTILPRMLARHEEAHIVNTASLSGLYGDPGLSAYNASKYAVVGLSDSLRRELEGTKVGVSVLYPGLTATGFVSNSVKAVQDRLGGTARASAGMANALAGGMNPDKVGEFVAQSVERGDYHIFSHIDWKPIIEQVCKDRLAAFTTGADPGFHADLANLFSTIARDSKA